MAIATLHITITLRIFSQIKSSQRYYFSFTLMHRTFLKHYRSVNPTFLFLYFFHINPLLKGRWHLNTSTYFHSSSIITFENYTKFGLDIQVKIDDRDVHPESVATKYI